MTSLATARGAPRRPRTPRTRRPRCSRLRGGGECDLPSEPDDRLWLFGIARRVHANAERAERRRSQLRRRLAAQPASVPEVPPSAGGEAEAIARALAALSPSDRELLLLTGWEELTPAQIAQLLNRPAPLISRRLHRARRRFAAALTAAGGQAGARGNPILMEAE